jgi:CDGSH-type Zn-finger protein
MSGTKIKVKPDGALLVEGDFEIVDAEGNTFGLGGRTAISLCRCGLSKTKPFCDGSHKGNFEAPSHAFDLPQKK